jgi:hypothetical protein
MDAQDQDTKAGWFDGWMVALIARYGRENVRVINGMVEKRGTSTSGAPVWHVMGKAN